MDIIRGFWAFAALVIFIGIGMQLSGCAGSFRARIVAEAEGEAYAQSSYGYPSGYGGGGYGMSPCGGYFGCVMTSQMAGTPYDSRTHPPQTAPAASLQTPAPQASTDIAALQRDVEVTGRELVSVSQRVSALEERPRCRPRRVRRCQGGSR